MHTDFMLNTWWLTSIGSHIKKADTLLLAHNSDHQALDTMIKIPANMLDKLVEVNFSDATFIQTLQECMNSAVFRVAVRGESCVMKMVSV